MTADAPLPDLSPPERAPGERQRRRFRRTFGHLFLWALLGVPVAAMFGLLVLVLPGIGASIAGVATFGAAAFCVVQAIRQARRP